MHSSGHNEARSCKRAREMRLTVAVAHPCVCPYVLQSVTLEDLYNGGSRTIKVARKVLCKSCKGSGAKGGLTTTCKHW